MGSGLVAHPSACPERGSGRLCVLALAHERLTHRPTPACPAWGPEALGLGGRPCRCSGRSPVGSSQEQAQDAQHVHASGQRIGGQAPGTEPQEGVPQKAWGGRETPHCSVRGRLLGRQMGSPSTAAPRWSRPACPPSSPRSQRAALTCEHAGEEHGGEVVVEVEDPAHQEEGEVMHHPAEQELPASSQQDLGQP